MLSSAFAALNQAKIIENRLVSPKPDTLLSLQAAPGIDCRAVRTDGGRKSLA